MGIELIEPGKYETFYGEPPILELKHEAINYIAFEKGSSIVYWDEEKQQFVKIATSELGGEFGVQNLFRGFSNSSDSFCGSPPRHCNSLI